MNKTPQDLTFFKSMSETDSGRYLAEYVKRLIDCVYDSRNWKEGDTKESAALAARILQEHLLDNIRSSKAPAVPVNQFE